MSDIVEKLVKIANKLDDKGLEGQAKELDAIAEKLARMYGGLSSDTKQQQPQQVQQPAPQVPRKGYGLTAEEIYRQMQQNRGFKLSMYQKVGADKFPMLYSDREVVDALIEKGLAPPWQR